MSSDLQNTQEKTVYGFGYKPTLTRNKDDVVIENAGGIADARIRIDHIHWYVPLYTHSIQQQSILSSHKFEKKPAENRFF